MRIFGKNCNVNAEGIAYDDVLGLVDDGPGSRGYCCPRLLHTYGDGAGQGLATYPNRRSAAQLSMIIRMRWA